MSASTTAPYKLKQLANIGELGDPIDSKHMSIPCRVYRFMQDEKPARSTYRGPYFCC